MLLTTQRGIYLVQLVLAEKTAHHLFSVDTNYSKSRESVKLIRKSKWHFQNDNQNGEFEILLR